eukprot:TRINITY_DN284_c0_g1_i2.p1 TRINITY_DN284_c0_g1~~TRINITY_DN284_c0_g1_i2.p1  ORF type:complete len:565 (-),score=129.66 TRINITY_DN284_c0_g1_i2:319-2013(-)
MMVRLAKPQGYVILSPSRQQVATQLAAECIPLIFEPKSRFYTSPVLVLDFQSLYPSQIIAHNYCYSTCLGRISKQSDKKFGTTMLHVERSLLRKLEENVTISPNAVMFTKREVRAGVLPRMLKEVLSTRVMVKDAMKQVGESDKTLHRMLDYRQLALKLLANVTYGYTSASFSGRMPCVDIADSIVQSGRATLERAIRVVEAEWNAEVVYGDTDSLFVHLPGATREDAFRIGKEIAERITALNPKPVTLKFEKVYHPCVLMAKKRYVGWMFESPAQTSGKFDAKGIETVRRDTCFAVKKVMEKSLRMLFTDPNVSAIKHYVQRQFAKILAGRVSVQDFVFAKEVRLGTYSGRGQPPPAAIVSTRMTASDPNAEPRFGERVPYVVVTGEPGSRLVDLVVTPQHLLDNASRLRLNAQYYITKQIIPALERVFNLIGVDVKAWFSEMPRSYRSMYRVQQYSTDVRRTTIDQYYLSRHCPVCDGLTVKGLCQRCSQQKQRSAMILSTRIHELERRAAHVKEICMACMRYRDPNDISCNSTDCDVYYERRRTDHQLSVMQTYSDLLANL